MKDIIVFIPKDIDVAIQQDIAEILRKNQIKTTNIKEKANVILTNKQIQPDLTESLRDAIAQIIINTPVILLPEYTEPKIKQKRPKNFVQTNVNIQRINKIKQYNQIQRINRTRHK